MKTIEALLGEHPYFQGMSPAYLALIAGCGRNVQFQPGQYIHREGQEANTFYAIRQGKVALEMFAPGRGPVTLHTLGEGEVVGWSWLFPPYRWLFDARAVELTRAVHFDGLCLRGKCEADPVMGFDFMKRFAQVAVARLDAARLQLLDVYGTSVRK
jgi:CRP/FNR family transcriptional regulator, cyclic AMP receptor protein